MDALVLEDVVELWQWLFEPAVVLPSETLWKPLFAFLFCFLPFTGVWPFYFLLVLFSAFSSRFWIGYFKITSLLYLFMMPNCGDFVSMLRLWDEQDGKQMDTRQEKKGYLRDGI